MKIVPGRSHLINTLLPEYVRLTGVTKMVSPDDAAQKRTRQLRAGMEYLESRRWRLAEMQSRTLIAADPHDIEALLILGLAIAGSGEATRAAPILARVRHARPEHGDPCRDLDAMRPRVSRALVAGQYRGGGGRAPAGGR